MNVYSFSLFGSRSGYFMKFFPSIIKSFYCLYDINDGWNIRIYHDTISMRFAEFKFLDALCERGLISLCHVPNEYSLPKAALTRMMSIWDDSIDISVFRDLDYLPTYKERQMMETFFRSDAVFHTCSSHECHLCPMMAGIIAVKNKEFIKFTGINSWNEFVGREPDSYFDKYGKDQDYLVKHYWEAIKPITCEHRLLGVDISNCKYSYKDIESIDLPINTEVKERSDSFGCCIGGYTSDEERNRAIRLYENNLPTYIKNLILESEEKNA
jgi:hypothetical protein